MLRFLAIGLLLVVGVGPDRLCANQIFDLTGPLTQSGVTIEPFNALDLDQGPIDIFVHLDYQLVGGALDTMKSSLLATFKQGGSPILNVLLPPGQGQLTGGPLTATTQQIDDEDGGTFDELLIKWIGASLTVELSLRKPHEPGLAPLALPSTFAPTAATFTAFENGESANRVLAPLQLQGPTAVPEPASVAAWSLIGVVALVRRARRSRSAAHAQQPIVEDRRA